ncbi:MAG: efflux RND transporter periplasmic adaptor subunit [Prolixibacteraceae bacterium]|jgi:Cu(I)/Ag(I) efflux system membrane fusion protein
MKDYKIFQNKWVKPAIYIVGGLILGWLIFHQSGTVKEAEGVAVQEHQHNENEQQIWTCSMHPQIRMDKPGQCPICGMDLIPVQSATAELDPDAVHMTEEAIRLAEVQTTVIGKQNAEKEVTLYGKVQTDERRIKTQAAHVPGRIEELRISFTGEQVRKGQVIARIYSPAMITAQEELLQAKMLKPEQPALVDAAREKLRQWKLTDDQIAAIEQGGKAQTVFDVTANVSGIVLTKKVNQGDYVQQGAALFEVVDLSSVWVLFDAYESDLPWIKNGSSVSFTLQSLPGQKFSGKVSFIDPVINPATRVALVRVEAFNPGGVLKPEMFVNGVITSALPKYNDGIVIPQSAVLWTGPRSVVYVKVPGSKEPEFRLREIEIGPSLSNAYVVLSGLTEGEEIVTNGTFAVDASAQLAGKPSMMNPEGNQGTSGSMPGMDMGTDSATPSATQNTTPGATLSRTRSNMGMKMIKVSGNCDMCKDRIETAAKSVSGVTSADWSIETKMLNVQFDSLKSNSDAIQKAIAAVGHDTEKYKAPDDVYKELPECCLYRK